MKKIYALLCLIFVMGCSPLMVKTDYNHHLDFNRYQTFSFSVWETNDQKLLDDAHKSYLEAAITDQLTQRGLSKKSEAGDFIIKVFIVEDRETSLSAYNDHYTLANYNIGWGWGAGGLSYGTSNLHYDESHYEIGTLIIDLVDSKSKILAWQGVAKSAIDNNPDNDEEMAHGTVEIVFKKFPISPIK